jgi:DNA-binding transcriptional LysR family regulator
MVFVCTATHPLADRAHVHLTDLAAQEFIQFPTGWGIRRRLDAAFATLGTHPPVPGRAKDRIDRGVAGHQVTLFLQKVGLAGVLPLG